MSTSGSGPFDCYASQLPSDVFTALTTSGGNNFFDSSGNPIGFVNCGGEESICTFQNLSGQNADVLFGSNSLYSYANVSGTNVPCSRYVFGDPNVGNTKYCFYRQSTLVPPPGPPSGPPPPGPPSNKKKILEYVGIGIVVLVIIIIFIIFIALLVKKKPE